MQWTCVGHEEQKAYVARLLDEGRLAHAYLLAGPEGVGKRMFADDVVRALVPHGYEPDLMRLAPVRDDEGVVHDIPIEAVHDLNRWIVLRPAGAAKAVIIDDADRLGREAANRLLKTLEEPPAYAKFLLVTSRPGAVLATIMSRCERLDFGTLDDASMRRVLAGRKLDADDRALLAAAAHGRPGMALRMIEDRRLPAVARHIAGLESALNDGIAERLAYAKAVADDAHAVEIVGWWLSWVHARLAEKPGLAPVAAGLLELAGRIGEPQYNRRLLLEHFLLEAGQE